MEVVNQTNRPLGLIIPGGEANKKKLKETLLNLDKVLCLIGCLVLFQGISKVWNSQKQFNQAYATISTRNDTPRAIEIRSSTFETSTDFVAAK